MSDFKIVNTTEKGVTVRLDEGLAYCNWQWLERASMQHDMYLADLHYKILMEARGLHRSKIFFETPKDKVLARSGKNGSPTLIYDPDGIIRDAGGQWYTSEEARNEIDRNMLGEPTLAAIKAGIIPESWPYRCIDETQEQSERRINGKN